MIVRLATTKDLTQFDLLWAEYLEENHKQGDAVLPSQSNKEFFRRVARIYMNNPQTGCVIMAFDGKVPAGVVMWGMPLFPSPIETTHGVVAHGWGTYVRPEHRGEGVSRDMRDMAKGHLQAIGCDTLVGSVRIGNANGVASVHQMGFEQGPQAVFLDLKRSICA
jgi:GNAT superfamily N-acetyltransferase